MLPIIKQPEKLFRYRGEEKGNCDLFEEEVAQYTGAKHALMVSSGTQALVCALTSLEIGPGDEVILPAYTFIATPAAVIDVGAIPVIVDIDESLGISPEAIRKNITPYTKAIIAVHMQSVPNKLDEIYMICNCGNNTGNSIIIECKANNEIVNKSLSVTLLRKYTLSALR